MIKICENNSEGNDAFENIGRKKIWNKQTRDTKKEMDYKCQYL